jgi:hypothetical protein
MARLRISSLILLVLTLTLGSLGAAVARHQPHAVGEVVLCTNAGEVTLAVDAEGRPSGPAHACAECLPPLLALAGGEGDAAGAPLRLVPATLRPTPPAPPMQRLSRAHTPRGPPSPV